LFDRLEREFKPMTVRVFKFNAVAKHGRHTFVPNTPLGFEDPDAVPYFTACGWGEETDEEPVYVYSQGEVDVDPATIHVQSGLLVKDIIPHGTADAAKEAGVKPRANPGEVSVDSVLPENHTGPVG